MSYLLQRMEAYRGLAILATNMKRRARLRLPPPHPFRRAVPVSRRAQRAEIWRRIFPANTPTDGLDLVKLSRLNVAGGNIRNVALNAAFLAADAREPCA